MLHMHVVQISYASTSAALSDRSVYPNLFRTVPSDEPLAPALATVMQYYGWRTLSILTEQQTQFTEVHILHACTPQVPCVSSYTLCLKHLLGVSQLSPIPIKYTLPNTN